MSTNEEDTPRLVTPAITQETVSKARVALLRIAQKALTRADSLLDSAAARELTQADWRDANAARLIESASKAIEVAIGPVDPPDVIDHEALAAAVARVISKPVEVSVLDRYAAPHRPGVLDESETPSEYSRTFKED